MTVLRNKAINKDIKTKKKMQSIILIILGDFVMFFL